MASKRQIKKNLRKQTIRSLSSKLAELSQIDIEMANVDKEIEKARKQLKQKRSTLSQLQYSLAQVSGISQRSIELIAQDVSKTSLGYDSDRTHSEHYAAIKKYNEYVDKGLIKRQSVLGKYEIADFMERIMTEEEFEDYIREANEKAEKLYNDSIARMKITPADRWGF